MAGRYLTQEEMWRICRAAAEKAATVHGIKDIDGFTQALMQVSWAESKGPTAEDGWFTWDTQSVHDQGQGFGLFGLHNQGYAGNLSKEQRLDPQQNADAAAMELGKVWRDGDTLEGNVTRMTGPQGQNPADPKALYRNAMSARNQVERQSMRAYEAGGQAGQGAAANEMIPAFISYFGLQDEEGYTASQQAMDIILDDPWKASTLYQAITAGEAGEADVPTWEREATEARTAVNWADARRIIQTLGGETYEQGRQRILDQIDEKRWSDQQAISEFNAWMSGALEAGKRAETVYGEQMKRATYTRPTETYERPAHRQTMESYGLPYTPERGIAVETLPNLEQMYGQWHQKMGISQQAPPTAGGWSGQGMGQGAPGGQPTGVAAAQDFLKQLMQRYAPQFGAGRA